MKAILCAIVLMASFSIASGSGANPPDPTTDPDATETWRKITSDDECHEVTFKRSNCTTIDTLLNGDPQWENLACTSNYTSCGRYRYTKNGTDPGKDVVDNYCTAGTDVTYTVICGHTAASGETVPSGWTESQGGFCVGSIVTPTKGPYTAATVQECLTKCQDVFSAYQDFELRAISYKAGLTSDQCTCQSGCLCWEPNHGTIAWSLDTKPSTECVNYEEPNSEGSLEIKHFGADNCTNEAQVQNAYKQGIFFDVCMWNLNSGEQIMTCNADGSVTFTYYTKDSDCDSNNVTDTLLFYPPYANPYACFEDNTGDFMKYNWTGCETSTGSDSGSGSESGNDFVSVEDCKCKDTWTYWECNGEQSGCPTNDCDYGEGYKSWCRVSNPGCAQQEGDIGGEWAYCTPEVTPTLSCTVTATKVSENFGGCYEGQVNGADVESLGALDADFCECQAMCNENSECNFFTSGYFNYDYLACYLHKNHLRNTLREHTDFEKFDYHCYSANGSMGTPVLRSGLYSDTKCTNQVQSEKDGLIFNVCMNGIIGICLTESIVIHSYSNSECDGFPEQAFTVENDKCTPSEEYPGRYEKYTWDSDFCSGSDSGSGSYGGSASGSDSVSGSESGVSDGVSGSGSDSVSGSDSGSGSDSVSGGEEEKEEETDSEEPVGETSSSGANSPDPTTDPDSSQSGPPAECTNNSCAGNNACLLMPEAECENDSSEWPTQASCENDNGVWCGPSCQNSGCSGTNACLLLPMSANEGAFCENDPNEWPTQAVCEGDSGVWCGPVVPRCEDYACFGNNACLLLPESANESAECEDSSEHFPTKDVCEGDNGHWCGPSGSETCDDCANNFNFYGGCADYDSMGFSNSCLVCIPDIQLLCEANVGECETCTAEFVAAGGCTDSDVEYASSSSCGHCKFYKEAECAKTAAPTGGEHECTATHSTREGNTSEEKCLALAGCCFTSPDDCGPCDEFVTAQQTTQEVAKTTTNAHAKTTTDAHVPAQTTETVVEEEVLVVESSYGGVTVDQFNAQQDNFATAMASVLGVNKSLLSVGSITANSRLRRILSSGVSVAWNVDLSSMTEADKNSVTQKTESPTFNDDLKSSTETQTGLTITSVETTVTQPTKLEDEEDSPSDNEKLAAGIIVLIVLLVVCFLCIATALACSQVIMKKLGMDESEDGTGAGSESGRYQVQVYGNETSQ